MQSLSKVILILSLCFLNYSCGQTSNETIELNGKSYILKKGIDLSKFQSSEKKSSSIVFHDIRDNQENMIMGYIPLPENWKLKHQADKDGAFIFGPNNIKVFLMQSNAFVYSQLPGYNQMEAQRGQQIKPLKSAEQLVQEELAPLFAQNGVKLIKQYHVPSLKRYDENFEQFQFKPIPMRKDFSVLATEWEDKQGNAMLFIIHQYVAYSQEACYWGYNVNIMEAPKSHFKYAKTKYLYALENSKYNPSWLHTRYMKDAETSARMGKLHEGRMRELRAEGQRIIENGKRHGDMVDRNHAKFMSSHLETQTVSTGGSNYQVDSGSNVYWVNSNGEYIPTNDFNFDPNLDPNLNNETWTKSTKIN